MIALPLVVVAGMALGQSPDGQRDVEVRIPLNEAGEADVSALVGRLADRFGLRVDRPAAPVLMPVRGLAGTLTRTLIGESLGPAAAIGLEPQALTVRIESEGLDPSGLGRWRARIENLAAMTSREANRRTRYGMHALESFRPNDATRPTICLVHGMNSSGGSFVHMREPLEAAGFGLVVYDYPDNRDLCLSAPEFARDWAEFRRRAGERRPWSVLTHSMGGLLARHYVEGDGYAGDVSDLLLIAPPNRGSSVAKAQPLLQLIQGMRAVRGGGAGALGGLGQGLGEAADDLVPGSRFLGDLDRRGRRAGVRYHILAGDGGPLTPMTRARVEAQVRAVAGASGLLGRATRVALGDTKALLDEMTEGLGDGAVAVAATRLDGVADHATIRANHVELIRGPLLYPDPGPVACLPWVLDRLKANGPAR